jgi:hypothetical protein
MFISMDVVGNQFVVVIVVVVVAPFHQLVPFPYSRIETGGVTHRSLVRFYFGVTPACQLGN